MNVYRAAWLCSIARPPIPNGWVAIADGRVAGVGSEHDRPPAAPRDLGQVALLPALTNAHTHLELSWLRGRVPPAPDFVDWIKQLFVIRGRRIERADDDRVLDAARRAAHEMHESGTIGVGDISNSLATVELIRASGLRGLVFHELLGFNHTDDHAVLATRSLRETAACLGAGAVRVSVAPHAPYSVSPELFRAIRAEVSGSAVPITSVHLGESKGEVDFLRDGSGPWPGILKLVGAARDDWRPPGMSPVDYLDSLAVVDARTIIVHAVETSDGDLARLAQLGCTVVTCPRSNQWVGVGVPPIERFYSSGVKVAIGTDSLASVDDLNMFNELKTMRWLAPSVPAPKLLESATRVGAEALGLGDELGTIEVDKLAQLIAIDLSVSSPAGARSPASPDGNIEEYLVNGVDPRQIRWVTE
jgi:cytosine/adenosine deaminase-related metal-dependent hydrolase